MKQLCVPLICFHNFIVQLSFTGGDFKASASPKVFPGKFFHYEKSVADVAWFPSVFQLLWATLLLYDASLICSFHMGNPFLDRLTRAGPPAAADEE